MASQSKLVTQKAPLFSDFGQYLARQWFGSDAIDCLPEYTRTSRHSTGLRDNHQINGWLVWGQSSDDGGFPGADENIIFKYIEIDSKIVLSEGPEQDDENPDSILEKLK